MMKRKELRTAAKRRRKAVKHTSPRGARARALVARRSKALRTKGQ